MKQVVSQYVSVECSSPQRCDRASWPRASSGADNEMEEARMDDLLHKRTPLGNPGRPKDRIQIPWVALGSQSRISTTCPASRQVEWPTQPASARANLAQASL